ncbi:MAG: hypothetical protein RLZZ500_1908 [Bacteroidota bacterium]|jgi:hypothetical protein
MKKLVVLALVFSSLAFSQIEKKVGDFTKVTAFDQIDVLLVQGNENKIILSGGDANEVEVVNKNGELKIRMPLTKMLSGEGISATVYFKKLEAVEANEGSHISCETVLKTTFFDLIAKEGAQIDLTLEVSKLSARTANGSQVTVTGKAKNQEVIVNSGGIYKAEKLITEQTTITGNAGGEASVFATELVDAKIRAGGTISIYGNPKQINEKTIAGGTIRQVK